MCLLLLLANLLLWENVSSTPDVLSTKDLYDHVVEQSHTNYDMSADIYHEFNIKFAKASWLNDKVPIECHTASITTPENIKQIRATKTEDLLKAVIAISRAWDYPLIHLILATAALPTESNEMMQRINDVKHGIIELLKGLEVLLSRPPPSATFRESGLFYEGKKVEYFRQMTANLPFQTKHAGMCMLLLVSSLLLWEHAVSKPTGIVSTEDLYDRVVEQSHITYNLAADIYHEFTEDILKAIINITNAWEEPLKHLASAVPSLPKPSDDMLKTINAVRAKNLVLLEGLKTILTRTKTVYEKTDSPVLSGLSDLKSADEDTQLFAFYSLVRCLRRDTHKIDTFLKVLRCRVVFNNECLY
ncbi:Prolactin-3D4 [Microtus ochrogaster]|uniref:Prolactin-3D4 n=1 Tax=Microtus ochrogaster TaxID=79684 RepID=A0A8J6KQN7_MICOH|nr:Prolactin-3D4 [Microtus ochrogaster]